MTRYNAFTDPFSLVAVATLIKPLLGHNIEGVEEDPELSLKLRSAVEYLEGLYRRSGVDKPREIAYSVVIEVLRECLRRGC